MAHEDMFGDDYLHFYADITSNAVVQPEVDAILTLLGLPPGSTLIEIGCGEGRLLRELARRGYRCTGIDHSRAMIDAAMRSVAGHPPITYRVVDVRELAADRTFDAALSWYTSFGYEDEAGDFAVLRAIHARLRCGGRFAIDVINRDAVLRDLQHTRVAERGDDFMIDQFSFDAQTNRMNNKRIYIRGGVRRVSFSVRLYVEEELRMLLSHAGFSSIRTLQPAGLAPDTPAPRVRLAATAA
jgi:cyclopropane fatty-acyl-phospholipid synthase-like methyltransferase